MRASVCVAGRSVVGMDGSQAHPLSLDEKEAHLQSRHISLSSHALSVTHKGKHTLLTHYARCVCMFMYAHVATGLAQTWFSSGVLLSRVCLTGANVQSEIICHNEHFLSLKESLPLKLFPTVTYFVFLWQVGPCFIIFTCTILPLATNCKSRVGNFYSVHKYIKAVFQPWRNNPKQESFFSERSLNATSTLRLISREWIIVTFSKTEVDAERCAFQEKQTNSVFSRSKR